ncbi:MAG: hypothetical protein C4520_20485 [Candidatus Abyssobacteria bacterium SURF_5]|uniref:Uncharacterized protein n=1 Tax=Abyssobacteria bacterium (strain SURF_5) TaxID=2093360 RepID=A0A3A4NEI8_ABYX5|nr:MAG: hypothetical protein C4520_20485 [Candidatus Abyssubacteria bacterium SURF_5]
MGRRHRKTPEKGFKDISHYFLSAAEADEVDTARTAGHQAHENPPMLSDNSTASPQRSLQPMRRKENCASCAHLIARAGQPFQCRIYSVDHFKHKVKPLEAISLHQGHTCVYFMRITSGQIEEILRSHGSTLSAEYVRESPHTVEERTVQEKTVTIEPYGDLTAEEALREELLRYLLDGYSIIDATVTLRSDVSDEKHRSSKTTRIRLHVREEKPEK